MDREARGGSIYEIRTWWQSPGSVCVKGSRRCCSTCNLYMQVDMWSTRWNGQPRGVAMHANEACGQPCVRWCVDLHALQSCSWPSGRGCVILHETETCSQPCGARGEPLALDCLGWDSEGLYLLVGDCNSLSNARLLTPHSLLFQVTSSKLVEVAGG
ncbi:hypothetical protein F2Q70_00027751 [Brassica cretica]|uniref:Uncharacterized protein n=1 Tax=Brassica cretica TaxID=69181 RepID=A0A8S9LD01_BRACR|nr:hypothetical protein F2Q70_00027751 [Brassica cretica]